MEIQSSKPYFPAKVRRSITAQIDEILASGQMTMGRWVRKLEDAFAAYTGARHAVAVSSGTSALEILLRFFKVEDFEVIIPTNTFLASANAAIFAGGKPVLADIHPQTLALDPEELCRRITSKTRVVMLVHIAGLITPHLDDMKTICRQHNLILIEDAAHAAGAKYADCFAGNVCDGGAFSFYPTKVMTTGEGGMLTTNDDNCADFARSLRCHGIETCSGSRGSGQFVRLGHNWRMSEIQAVIGYHQLQMLDRMVSKRNEIAGIYRQGIAGIDGFEVITCPEQCLQSYYKFPVVTTGRRSARDVIELLKKRHGVQCGTIYWPPVHLQPFYRSRFDYKPGDFPQAEQVLSRTFALPIYPELTQAQANFVIDALEKTV